MVKPRHLGGWPLGNLSYHGIGHICHLSRLQYFIFLILLKTVLFVAVTVLHQNVSAGSLLQFLTQSHVIEFWSSAIEYHRLALYCVHSQATPLITSNNCAACFSPGLEKVPISQGLVTLLHICGVIPTPQSQDVDITAPSADVACLKAVSQDKQVVFCLPWIQIEIHFPLPFT